VFLLSYIGHTDILARQARHLLQQLVKLMLVFMGLLTPVVQTPAAHFHQAMARIHRKTSTIAPSLLPAIKPVISPEMTSAPMNMIHRQMTYIFEGKATLHDQPCPNTNVVVHLTFGDRSVTQETMTGADGAYRLKAVVVAETGDPVDWTLEAYTPDLKKVELSGRKIVQRTEEQAAQELQAPVIVNTPVEFLVSLSK